MVPTIRQIPLTRPSFRCKPTKLPFLSSGLSPGGPSSFASKLSAVLSSRDRYSSLPQWLLGFSLSLAPALSILHLVKTGNARESCTRADADFLLCKCVRNLRINVNSLFQWLMANQKTDGNCQRKPSNWSTMNNELPFEYPWNFMSQIVQQSLQSVTAGKQAWTLSRCFQSLKAKRC